MGELREVDRLDEGAEDQALGTVVFVRARGPRPRSGPEAAAGGASRAGDGAGAGCCSVRACGMGRRRGRRTGLPSTEHDRCGPASRGLAAGGELGEQRLEQACAPLLRRVSTRPMAAAARSLNSSATFEPGCTSAIIWPLLAAVRTGPDRREWSPPAARRGPWRTRWRRSPAAWPCRYRSAARAAARRWGGRASGRRADSWRYAGGEVRPGNDEDLVGGASTRFVQAFH